MRKFVDGLALIGVWLSVAAVVVGFVLPWASLDVKYRDVAGTLTKKIGRIVVSVKRGAETVTGELPDLSNIPSQVNGPQIPQMVNRKDAQVIVGLVEMFTGRQGIGAKSYAVYALPVTAVLFGVALTMSGRVRIIAALVGVASVTMGGGTLWKLLTTHTDTLPVKLVIERGLWVIGWAYVALGALAFARLLISGRRSI